MNIREKFLYEIWKKQKFNSVIETDESEKIEIIDSGLQNSDQAGPDFSNARIKIGNITYLGDVEIDTTHNDWKAHGHNIDKKYNRVILHVVLSKEHYQPYVFTREGRKVPSVCLLNFIEDSLSSALKSAIEEERNNRTFNMPCMGRNDKVPVKLKTGFVMNLGVERFKKKSERILKKLKQMVYLKEMNIREPVISYDFGEDFINKKFASEEFSDPILWQQLTYEMIFEALGYSKNKDMMLRLAKSVNINFLNNFASKKNLSNIIECSLFRVSGIVPDKLSFKDDDSAEYVRQLIEGWNSIKSLFDGPSFRSEQWHYFKIRPQNFPTIRIAGGARILKRILSDDLIKNLIEHFQKDSSRKMVKSHLRSLIITPADGYWKSYYMFEKKCKDPLKYFVGVSRADEIIINVVLPILFLYFEIFLLKEPAKRVKKMYLSYYQKSSNQIVNHVSSGLGLEKLNKQSVYYQGFIELFRNYCVKERCLECKIGEQVF